MDYGPSDRRLLGRRNSSNVSGCRISCNEKGCSHLTGKHQLIRGNDCFYKAEQVANEDFLDAAQRVRRQITPSVIAKYIQWRDATGLS